MLPSLDRTYSKNERLKYDLEAVIYTPVGGPVGVWWTPVDPPESGGLSLIIVYMTFWKYKLQYKSTGLRWSLAH
jgi:hypothetical protein